MKNEKFEICSLYKREDLDFVAIQRDRNNPIDQKGYPTYPVLMPSGQGSSYTYRVSKEWFFKRKLQDGGHPHTIFSQHHFNQAYNELYGTFDDLGEVIAYHLSDAIVDPQTGKKIVNIPEYKLATYLDKDQILLRGCISKNVCANGNQRLVPMSYILQTAGLKGNSIDVYMQAIEAYITRKGFICDLNSIRRTLIKDSYFNWKIGNSDNHKNNILLIIETTSDGKTIANVSPLIDNGSAYELSVRYMNDAGKIRMESLLSDDKFSKENDEGQRVFEFQHYPYMHNAFQLESDTLAISDTSIAGKNYSYEYSLASEMLSDNELYHQIYEINRQLSPDVAIKAINETYGSTLNDGTKSINWPPYLKEFMHATNDIKTKVLTYVVADYYLQVISNSLQSSTNNSKFKQLYQAIHAEFVNIPLQASKEAYDELFIALANKYGISIDRSTLSAIQFKKNLALHQGEQEPNE